MNDGTYSAIVYIYALLDPATAAVRYVGKAKNPNKRLTAHINDRAETRKARWIRSLLREGLVPVLRVLQVVAEASWQDSECHWIAHFRTLGCDLTNATEGGEGLTGVSEDLRQHLREQGLRGWQDAVSREKRLKALRSPVRCTRISVALKGKTKSAEHMAKLPQNQPGRVLSAEHKLKVHNSLLGNTRRRGKKASPETCARIAAARRGKPHTNKGRTIPSDQRLKISQALKGKAKTQEWKDAIRASSLLRWERYRSEKLVRDTGPKEGGS